MANKLKDTAVNALNHIRSGDGSSAVFGHDRQNTGVPRRSGLVPVNDREMRFKNFTFTPVQLSLPPDTTVDEWRELGQFLQRIETSIQWHIGDWAEHAIREWNWTYQKIADEFGYEKETLYSYTSIVRRFPSLIRNQGVTFSHHRLVAGMDEQDADYWLGTAANNGWTVKQLRAAIYPKSEKPPTLLGKFNDDYEKVSHKYLKMASGAGRSERKQMALKLRQLADDLENLG